MASQSLEVGRISKKRQREETNTCVGVDSSFISDASTRPIYQRRFTTTSSRFNDSVTSDVIFTLHFESVNGVNSGDVELYLHSDVLLGKSNYFSAFLSDRWQGNEDHDSSSSDSSLRNVKKATTFNVPSSMGSVDVIMTIFELFYSTDDFSEAINTVSSALSIINTALQLMFEDCVRACIRFLEAVSWSEEEERRVLSLLPLLKPEESEELFARFFPVEGDASDEMLHGLILEAVNHENPNLASSKAFVAKYLRDFPSRVSVRRALNQAFEASLEVLKRSLDLYPCPYVWAQRENVQAALSNARHLTWLIERMIELRVGENAVKEWIDQESFTDALMEFFGGGYAGRDIVVGLTAHVIRSTYKLADAVATGSILADRQVRMSLVKEWLPVLIVSKEEVLPIFSKDESMYRDLEKSFLRIILTLPMTDSQELLKQCIRFSTLNVEESPHLLSAINTWFRRATQPSD